jgi:D-alanyl-D-alanine dipeptidase
MATLNGIAAQWRSVAAAFVLAVAMPYAGMGQETQTPPARTAKALPKPLVYLRDVDPSIVQDMRYAGRDNFTGAVVPGYTAAECILTRQTAEALATVQRRVTKLGLSLKVYDCYRPSRAVAAFMRWTRSASGDTTSSRFHPVLPRHRLAALGYIGARSGHSRGHVVDLTLIPMPRHETPVFVPEQIYGSCTASVEKRAPDDSLDMGTAFDCFDERSSTHASGISIAQAKNRQTLADAMTRAGFAAYHREWWHFSFPAGDPGRFFDVDVAAHP